SKVSKNKHCRFVSLALVRRYRVIVFVTDGLLFTLYSHAWNPAVGSDCSALFYQWYVCIGIQPRTSATFEFEGYVNATGTLELPPYVSFTPLPTSELDPNYTPSPTQAGFPPSCTGYYQAQEVSVVCILK